MYVLYVICVCVGGGVFIWWKDWVCEGCEKHGKGIVWGVVGRWFVRCVCVCLIEGSELGWGELSTVFS